MWNLKNKINKQNRNKITDTVNILMIDRWKVGVGGIGEKEEEIKKYELVVTKYSWGHKE